MGIFDFLKKKENTVAGEDAVYLQAVPVSRKRMDLLWLDSSNLSQTQQLVAQQGVVTVTMGDNSNFRNHEITQEDITWAKQIEPIVYKAFMAGQRKDYRESIRYYKKALDLAPGCDLFLMSIGSAYAWLGEKKKAITYLERAAGISPGNSRIRNNLNAVRNS
jgi:tetratricopeptide (TPR) repeat protein